MFDLLENSILTRCLFRRKEMDFLSGLNDRSKDVVYNLLLDYDPIINNKPNPEDHGTKLFPAVKKSTVVRPEHMMASTSPRADSSGSLKPSDSQESLGTSAPSDKDESANGKSENGSDKKESSDEAKAEPSPPASLPKSNSVSEDLTELREPSGEEPK